MDEGRRFNLRDISPRQWALVGGLWVVVMGAAIGIALGLDQPVGSGARDRATPIVAGPVVQPGQELTAAEDDLPPVALFLPRVSPIAVNRLPAAERAQAIAVLAQRVDDVRNPQRLSELGAVLQASSDGPAAEEAYREALRLDPEHTPSRIGLVMVDAASGSGGLDRADRALLRLARELPRSQLVAFNRGWLALYRRDGDTAVAELERTISLGGDTQLGMTARSVRDASERQGQAQAQGAGP